MPDTSNNTDMNTASIPHEPKAKPKATSQRIEKLEDEVIALKLALNEAIARLSEDQAINFVSLLRKIEGQKPEVEKYVRPNREKAQQAGLHNRDEPWRTDKPTFDKMQAETTPNWEINGNARVAQRLAKHLNRTSGHTEGQLYLNWCEQVGVAAVKKFWIGRGFEGTPEGL